MASQRFGRNSAEANIKRNERVKPMSLTIFLLAASLLNQDSQLPTINIKIQPNVVAVGQSAVLSWNVIGADNCYLSSRGIVNSSGRLEVNPGQTTGYTLVAESKLGVFTKTVVIEVAGSKGGGDFPSEELFKYAVASELSAPSLTDVLRRIQFVLQDSMSFVLNQYSDSNERYVFVTNLRQRPDLVGNGDPRIGARRLAFLVSVSKERKKSELFKYTIKSVIEYKRKVERTWRNEGDESIFLDQTRKLQAAISNRF
jgi:hypothetical protein